MASKVWKFINWGVLLIAVLFFANMVWHVSSDDKTADFSEDFFTERECVDLASGFEYDACYDAYSEAIFLKIKRGSDAYRIDSLEASFVDLSTKSYDLGEVPAVGKEMAYKLSAEKNPHNLNVKLGIVKDFSEPICGTSESVFVDFCPAGTGGGASGVLISPIDGIQVSDFVEVEDFEGVDSDVFTLNLIDKEKVWESDCESDWQCGEWDACVDGVKKRNCKDAANCIASGDSPLTVQGCDGACTEDWECEWVPCDNGYSVPECFDLNECGTMYDVPDKLSCEEKGECVPEVECGEWTDCDVDYDFFNLIGAGVADLRGTKSRVCVDRKRCLLPQKEVQSCSVSVDIYTDRFERCGEEYIGVYDVLDDGLLAVVKEGTKSSPYLNIYFSDQDKIECDYCFDGIMNGDEDDVDCGGSCGSCGEVIYYDEGFWDWVYDLW
jgi:hypothetical protein